MVVRQWFRSAGPFLAQTIGVGVLVWSALELWRFDFRVQFNYLGDSLWFALLAKSVAHNGWAYFVPQLSAPHGLAAAAFPTMTNFDWLIMKAISLVSRDPAIVFNVFWLCTIFFTAWTGLLSLRLLGVPSWLAALGGLLYTGIPYTWMRSTGHLSLVFYSVPLLCVFAVYLVRGPVEPWKDAVYRRAGLLGACMQGFQYVYFSWFAILLFAAAGLLGYAYRRQRDIFVWAALGIVVLASTSLLNLAPSFYAWQKHGRPNIDYKRTHEAEVYGLKIRRLLLPHHENPIPALRSWTLRDHKAAFPNENENGTARLGLFGATGFLFLLWVSLNIRTPQNSAERTTIRTIAALNLIVLTVTTVGGFGAIINTLTVPDIRAYNRFSVFLAFFSISGLSLWVAELWRKTTGRSKVLVTAVVVGGAALSLYDQALDARSITRSYDRDKKVAAEVGTVVGSMETIFPERTAVFQFPITDFPADFNRGRMLAYDHSLPYLHTDHFRWSWPALTPRHIGWTRFIGSIRGPALVRALADAGFGAVWVDRFGYRDRGRAITGSVLSAGGVEVLQGLSKRYAVIDIRGAAGGRGGSGPAVGPPASRAP
jgi:phosphoglycerol transferase